MSKVRIIGGGLTGILAAFQAHRLGARDITLHERFEALGGVALPRTDHGIEQRDRCIYFGPKGHPVRSALEYNGLAFEDFENRFGAVSPTPCGDIAITHDFGGPALPTRGLELNPPVGDSLTDRLRSYPHDIAQTLTRYCQWHLGTWLDEVHASAVTAMGVNRIFPLGPDIVEIAAAKRAEPLYDDLYGLPRALWGRLDNVTASLPRGGFAHLFAQCRRELEALGVTVHTNSLISPQQALAERRPGDTLVWAADPTPLFKPFGMEPPKPVAKSFATYLFKAKYGGPQPFHVRNFTATGAVFRIYIYESRGQTLCLAECVREAGDAELRREIHRLMSSFGGSCLSLAEQVAVNVGPRTYLSMDAVRKLKALRATARRAMGDAFVAGGWEQLDRTQRFAEVNSGLAAALDVEGQAASAA